MRSIVEKEVIGPELAEIEKTLKGYGTSTRGGFIQFKYRSNGKPFEIKNINTP